MDWPSLLRDLKSAGLTQTQIAERIGITQPTVSDLANGVIVNPNFTIGSKLVELHRTEMAKQRPAKAA